MMLTIIVSMTLQCDEWTQACMRAYPHAGCSVQLSSTDVAHMFLQERVQRHFQDVQPGQRGLGPGKGAYSEPLLFTHLMSSGLLPLCDLMCRSWLARAEVRAPSNMLQTTIGSPPQLHME